MQLTLRWRRHVRLMDTEIREIKGILVHSHSAFPIAIGFLTGRLLCNVMAFAKSNDILEATAFPRPANTIAHLRAGFLPIEASWKNLSEKLAKQLPLLGTLANERGAAADLHRVLEMPRPTAARLLIPNPGRPPQAGAQWPQTC